MYVLSAAAQKMAQILPSRATRLEGAAWVKVADRREMAAVEIFIFRGN
jgi:hypothetical protein